ncbi:mediator of RNA polymerase II transcription subunit 25 [Parasteatoda tepidariorum]|uniref:mediator of RNA polymerase II transcription subunit 25 n=1 Tax=Parasteatoda tepidariorum TaxID=114398 RepID=UPI00077FA18C|nr:mediator of RNA polymerase II transcription subunit 25 [Parasteatoda tepidariorum]XP_015915623.1 mediator of RNA polymerase II transcription subunit 25 [Parasteatoda tepidariorum]
MVVADQSSWQADVVVVLEGTANLSPYFESLKTNYIIPTLEYFNGGPADDRDCGCDTNCTMYALVVFMAADCAPETAATVFGPTPSTHKFLTWLEKIKFIGGAGESHSHVAEGLSTALQVFDDFHTIRDSNIKTQKHCILICNSPPYPLPALESSAYSGLMTEQLAATMADRHINFSVLSLRKIPAFYRIYEKAGGDMQQITTKNYAKDSRHCILLSGYQLQERPISPPLMENKPTTASVCSPTSTAQKRPATNSPPHPRETAGFKQPNTQNYNPGGLEWPTSESQSGTMTSQNSVQSTLQAPSTGQSPLGGYGQSSMPAQPNQALPQRTGISMPSSHLNSMNQPNPPNVTITNKGPPQHSDGIRPQRGHSPVPNCGPRMTWNQAAAPSPPTSTPPTTSVLAAQLNIGPSNMPIRLNSPQIPLNQTVSNIVSQAQSTMNSGQNVLNAGGIRGSLSNIGLRMPTASSVPVSIGGSNPLAPQLNQHQGFGQSSQPQLQQTTSMSNTMPSMQSKLGNTNNGNQLISSQGQTMTTASTSNMPLQSVPGILPISQGTSQQGQQPTNPLATTKDRRTIWQGYLEFQEKVNPQQVQGQRVTHALACTFSSVVANTGELDVNADKWPNRLSLQLIPRQLIVAANLFAILKTAAKHVLIHFTQDCDALNKLCKNMSSGLVGCVQFPNNCDIRIMVILYMPDKRIYMGFIANDQEAFFNNIRQMYDNHRKQQQQKQRMQIASSVPQPENNMAVQPNTNTSANMMIPQLAPSNINPNGSQMNARMPINQQPVPQNNAPAAQAPANNNGMGHSQNMNAQTNNAARLNHLEAARQQNLLKIQQLQQTLEQAQQKELQYKAAQEQQQQVQQQVQQQQQQQQQQQMIDRQNAIRQLQQQLQLQQQQLAQQQQTINMQQMNQQGNHNPQLRNLLQQQAQQQLRRQQIQQNPMLMQHAQGMRQQMPGNIQQGGMASNVGQQQPQQQAQQNWGDLGMLDSLQP